MYGIYANICGIYIDGKVTIYIYIAYMDPIYG